MANKSCNPTTGLHYRNQADMLHCLSFYSKCFNSSHCKHFFHEVSSRNEGMPTALIPTFINQTAAHCNPWTTCATVFLLDGPSKNPLFTIHTLWTKTPLLDNSHLLRMTRRVTLFIFWAASNHNSCNSHWTCNMHHQGLIKIAARACLGKSCSGCYQTRAIELSLSQQL